jgi:dihydrolipoamide dehydrogenase
MEITIIGGGPGGYVAAIKAAQMGAKTLLVEKDLLGGTCLNYGCIPTKAMISDVKILQLIKGEKFLLNKSLHIDFRKIFVRRDHVVSQLRNGIDSLLKKNGITFIQGEGIIEAKGRVEVNGTRKEKKIIKSDVIIIASGGKSKEIPESEFDGTFVLKPEQLLTIKTIPKSLFIVGGGAIGVEIATIFSNLGCQVSLVEMMSTILPNEDKEISHILAKALARQGISVFTGYKVKALKKRRRSIEVTFSNGSKEQNIEVEKMIVAVGRIPNIPKEVAAHGIKLIGNAIRVDKQMRTTADGFYAVGDVVGGWMLAHVAMQQGMVAAEDIMGHKVEIDYKYVPNCIFTIPEMASVGLTEEVAKKNHSVKVGKFPFSDNPKAVADGEAEGFVKIISDYSSGKILGFHIIGPHASELISIASAFMRMEATVEELMDTIQAHPTLAEALREAAMDIEGEAIHSPPKNSSTAN